MDKMKSGDRVKVWGGVHPGTIAVQYGKNECEVLSVRETGKGKLLHIRYWDKEDLDDQWTGWVHEKQVELVPQNERVDKKRKLSMGEYNGLYAIAEIVFGQLLNDFKFDCLKEFSQEEIYQIYKKNANEVVDNILEDLDIEVDGGK